MRMLLPLLAISMTACSGLPGRQPEVARFDFGSPATSATAGAVGLAAVEVDAPSWLAGSGIQYRLAYAEPMRRYEYAESRWAAPPGELLARALQGRFAGSGVGRCRLYVDLDEFAQVFDGPSGSHWLLEARARLHLGTEVLARSRHRIATTAPAADARGGVAAATAAVSALGEELTGWLAEAGKCR